MKVLLRSALDMLFDEPDGSVLGVFGRTGKHDCDIHFRQAFTDWQAAASLDSGDGTEEIKLTRNSTAIASDRRCEFTDIAGSQIRRPEDCGTSGLPAVGNGADSGDSGELGFDLTHTRPTTNLLY